MTIYHLMAGEIDAALDWYQKDIEAHRPNAPMVAFAAWLTLCPNITCFPHKSQVPVPAIARVPLY